MNGRTFVAKALVRGAVFGAALLCCLGASAEVRTYTSAQTVSDVLSGDDSVVVDCGAGNFVAFTGANTFTGGVEIRSGGVIVSNATALGTGPVVCANDTAVRVCVKYADTDRTLNSAVIDRIQVAAPAEGEEEPHVSFQLDGPGLTNDVDFTSQPYLWLGAPATGDRPQPLVGTFEPCGSVYRFGYTRTVANEMRGIRVTGLCDAPDGSSRSVLVRGDGVTTFSGGSYTGGLTVEGPARIAVGGGSDFGTGVTNRPNDFVTLKDGAWLLLKNPNITYPATLGIRVEGTNSIHSCGASRVVYTTMKGPITGWGEIQLTDQGGIWFTSPSNTFTGVLRMKNTQNVYDVEIRIGDGANCSWAGSEIVQNNQSNHVFSVNCTSNFTLDAALSANGGCVNKYGRGALTFAKPFDRQPFTSCPDSPVLRIDGGAVQLTSPWTTTRDGVMELLNASTLDLGGAVSARLPLPYGNGRIVNPGGGAIALAGVAKAGGSFNGFLDGDAVVSVSGGSPWQMGVDAEVAGTLTVSSGEVLMFDGVQMRGHGTGASARTLFASSESERGKGLRMEAWYDIPQNYSFQASIERAATVQPDFVGDMTAFGDVFKSGEPNTAEGCSGPFADSFGGTRNWFLVKFTGYFTAETEGEYAFRAYADDGVKIVLDGTNTVINATPGDANTALLGSARLTAGAHPIVVWFWEKSGWEVLKVHMMAPGETGWSFMPTRLLSDWNGRHTALGPVTGSGTLELASAGAAWPEAMDLSGFSGDLMANAYTATTNAGAVAPCSSSIYFAHAWSPFGGNWTMKGRAAATMRPSGAAVELVGEAAGNSEGSLNSAAPLDLSRPFAFSFDYSVHEPWSGVNALGDGFSLVLHDGAKGSNNGAFSYDEGPDVRRIGDASAYGVQFYLMSWTSVGAWVKDTKRVGDAETNKTQFVLAKLRDDPMHVEMRWDLTNLVVRLEKGTEVWAMTNGLAKSELPARFPNGAYLGVWGRCGGWYTSMRMESLVVETADAGGANAIAFNGALGVTNGVAGLIVDAGVSAEIPAALDVVGAGGLAVAEGRTAALTSDTWTFDLANPDSLLTLSGAFMFPDATAETPITVELKGEPPPRTRVLADLTGVDGAAADALAFRLGDGYPGSYRLVYRDGKLSISNARGTMLIIR